MAAAAAAAATFVRNANENSSGGWLTESADANSEVPGSNPNSNSLHDIRHVKLK